MIELSIVVPVHREGEAARKVLSGLSSAVVVPHEVLVVHDEPDDVTVPVVRSLAATHPAVRAVHNSLGRGPALALRAGFAAARAAAVVVTMADGSDEPADIPRMLEKFRAGWDLVSASRYTPGGRQIGGPRLKSLLSRAAGRSLHLLGGLPTSDPTNAFKLYRKTMLDALALETREGFELSLEITVKAFLAGYRITEIPTVWRDRVEGTSNFRLTRWLPRYLHWWTLGAAKGRFATRRPPATSSGRASRT